MTVCQALLRALYLFIHSFISVKTALLDLNRNSVRGKRHTNVTSCLKMKNILTKDNFKIICLDGRTIFLVHSDG